MKNRSNPERNAALESMRKGALVGLRGAIEPWLYVAVVCGAVVGGLIGAALAHFRIPAGPVVGKYSGAISGAILIYLFYLAVLVFKRGVSLCQRQSKFDPLSD